MRLLFAFVASLLIGCQAVAGIDERVLAAPLEDAAIDVSASADAREDTATDGVSGDGTLTDATTTDTAVTDTAVTDTTSADTTSADVLVDAPVEASTDVATDDGPPDASVDANGIDALPSVPTIVINEIRATNGDFLELTNVSSAAVDVSGWGVTGTDANGLFTPPVRFIAGESIAPGGFLLIHCGRMPAPAGRQTDCGGPAFCYYADWGISASRGETLRVVRADNSIANEAVLPKDAVADGQSWGRIPDGVGAFVANSATPAAANTLP